MNVCVIGGAGYVGLITGLCLAEIGHRVINVDVDEERIQELQAGKSYIYEDGIELLLRRNLDAGRFQFSNDLGAVVESSDVVFIAVGTPSADDGHADLSQVLQVAESLRWNGNGYKVFAIKSTVPAGTLELLGEILGREKCEGQDFDIVVNPEFLREGKGLFDFFYPDRIIIGGKSEKARAVVKSLYDPIILGEVSWPKERREPQPSNPVPVIETDAASAQMVKYASNAFLATQISFINEIAGICDKIGADVSEVVRGMRHDPRIGSAYLNAGIGFGGPCLGKDLHSLVKIAEGEGFDPRLFRAVGERNERQVEVIIGKLRHQLGHNLHKKVVAAFGLAFKAGTNDVRNSISINIMDCLEQEGAIVRAHDPLAILEARDVRPQFTYFDDPYQAVDGADALLVLTDWPSFKDLDYYQVKARMASPYIVDGRNLLDPEPLKELGFTYVGVGRV